MEKSKNNTFHKQTVEKSKKLYFSSVSMKKQTLGITATLVLLWLKAPTTGRNTHDLNKRMVNMTVF